MKNNLGLPEPKIAWFVRIDPKLRVQFINLVKKIRSNHPTIKKINLTWATEQALKDFLLKHK